MTRLLPYLLLPLGVALLEYHGIQFWTVAVTGAWPEWFSVGFWLAWHAWGWPLLLEGGALWCWLQSRDDGRAGGAVRAAGWTLGGGVLTIVLCAAALWNVTGPVKQKAALTTLRAEKQEKVSGYEDLAGSIVMQAVKKGRALYTREMDLLLSSRAQSQKLLDERESAITEGADIGERAANFYLWLQIACVLLGQGLVVAAARAVGQAKGEEDGRGSEVTGDAPHVGKHDRGEQAAGQSQHPLSPLLLAKRALLRAKERIFGSRGRVRADGGSGVAAPPHGTLDFFQGRMYHRERGWLDQNAWLEANRDDDPKAIRTGTLISRPEGVEDAQAAAGVAVGERGEAAGDGGSARRNELGSHVGTDATAAPETRTRAALQQGDRNEPYGAAHPAIGGVKHDGLASGTPVPTQEIGESEPGTIDPEPGEPEGTTRAKAAWARIVTLWPMEEDQARAGYLGISDRDLNLLKHHERLAEEKKVKRHTKLISDNKLRVVELALEGFGGGVTAQAAAVAPRTKVRSL